MIYLQYPPQVACLGLLYMWTRECEAVSKEWNVIGWGCRQRFSPANQIAFSLH
jgi:hypothetical protein